MCNRSRAIKCSFHDINWRENSFQNLKIRVINRRSYNHFPNETFRGNLLGNFSQQATISNKNYGKNCYLDNFGVSLPFPLLTILRNNGEAWVKQCYGFAALYKGRGGRILNALFKIPIMFCHWLSEIYK